MRRQACAILGVSEFATEEEIKSAYRALVKRYHPDTGNTQNTQYYQSVVQAYEYLKTHPMTVSRNYGRVLGKSSVSSKSTFSYSSMREYAAFEKGYKRQKEARKVQFEQRIEEEKKKQEAYDKAMEAIRAIRMAEALKAMIQEKG